MRDETKVREAAQLPVEKAPESLCAVRDAEAYLVIALGLLRTIAEEAGALNEALAADEVTQKQARVRVQNIIGLAVTPEVEEWPSK